ncbi:hypothetical protein OY671_008121, partial [Metschnikowia pulcherrima]
MARSCSHHAICHVVASRQRLSHGAVNSAISPHASAYNTPAAVAELAPSAQASGDDPAQASHRSARNLGAPTPLAAPGMAESDIHRAATPAPPHTYPNPRPVERGPIRDSSARARMSYFTEAQSAEAVNARSGADIDPRLARIMRSLVTHLHAFIKDVESTGEEWASAIDFSTATGRICSAERQEFISSSDVLGASMSVDAINNRRPDKATQNTVLGPFHVAGAPERQMGESICSDGEGEACSFEGVVTDIAGRPVSDAEIDVWSDNADGFYDVQQPDVQPKWNNKGR